MSQKKYNFNTKKKEMLNKDLGYMNKFIFR